MWVVRRLVASTAMLLLVFCPSGPYHCSASLASPDTPMTVLISEFYPCGVCDDEYVVIANAGTVPVDLKGWVVSDGEGSLGMTADMTLLPGTEIAMSMNSSSYEAAYGRLPDVGLDSPSSSDMVQVLGTFRLADAGDELRLISPDGICRDVVRYGDCTGEVDGWVGVPVPSLRPGEVARRARSPGGCIDTDSAGDWTNFREFRYGYTTFEVPGAWVDAGAVTAFTSPDNSLGVILDEISGARADIRVCSYEMSSVPVVRALLDALQRGVGVRVLVDGSPVGGMDEDESSCLSVLSVAGADVYHVGGTLSEGVVRHFRAMHAKYLVLDSARIIVLSENLVESGVPCDTIFGNRGWGAVVDSPVLSSELARIFDEDSRASRLDIHDWATDDRFDASSTLPTMPTSVSGGRALEVHRTSSPAFVSLTPSPDGSEREPFLCPVLRDARRFAIEQFQVDLDWKDRWYGSEARSPLLECALESLRAGGRGRMLADSSWFNLERNEEVVLELSRIASSEELSGEFSLVDPRSPITLTHNKGLILDDALTVISSNNWVNASFSRNRELALSVESSEVAGYFSSAFDMDWYPDGSAPTAVVGGPSDAVSGGSVVLTAEGSTDDRVIAGYRWDIDCDGVVDCTDITCTFIASLPGTRTVELTVVDSWGNTDSTEFEVSTSAEWSQVGTHPSEGTPATWGAATCIIGVVSLLVLMHRRRG